MSDDKVPKVHKKPSKGARDKDECKGLPPSSEHIGQLARSRASRSTSVRRKTSVVPQHRSHSRASRGPARSKERLGHKLADPSRSKERLGHKPADPSRSKERLGHKPANPSRSKERLGHKPVDPSKSKEHTNATSARMTNEGHKNKAKKRSRAVRKEEEYAQEKLPGVDLSVIGLHDPVKQQERRERREAIRAFVTNTTFITVAIIVFLVVLSALAWRQAKQGPQELTKCVTPECTKYASLLAAAIDDTKKPCDNFFLHVCGAEIMHLKGASSTVEEIRIATFHRERDGLRMKKVPENDQTPLEKAAAYLQACESVQNTSGVDEVRKALREGGIHWPDHPDPSLDLVHQVFYMSAKLFTSVVFQVELNASVDGKERPVVGLGLDESYMHVLKMLEKHSATKRILGHFKLTYATFAATPAVANDKDRFQTLFDDLMEIGPNFANVTSAAAAADDSEILVVKPGDLPTVASATDYKTWDMALRRNFNETFDNVASVTIVRPKYFKTVFWALAKYGLPRMLDVFGWAAVQSLVHYSDWKLITSYYFSSEDQAVEAHQMRCSRETYASFRFAINVAAWLLVHDSTLNDVTNVANEVWQALADVLSDQQRTLLGDHVPPSKEAYLTALLEHHRISKPDKVDAFYSVVPAMTKEPLYNYVTVKASFWSHMRDPELKDMMWARHLELSTHLKGYSLLPRELSFPWWEAGAPYAIALGGLGVRMAATLYFQMLAKQSNGNRTNMNNFKCLAPSAKEDADVVDDIPAAAAALRVVWKAWQKAKARNSSLEMRLGPAQSDAVLFVSHCYFSCGRDEYHELLCNVPLMHSHDFARQYGCAKGSHMNPEKKCNITI
ncbi:endothelin-converting enzyme 1-like [Rhipicephalus microplus]|uniref:endothelin-converting enzyme 1-like n=1 Tax=Rhipicephalus microplus TaxID=6941 RepID=UPI003F6ACD43